MLFLVLMSCQAKARELPEPTPAIEVRDAQGALVAGMHPGHPCRGTIGTLDLQVGAAPLVAQVGDITWRGDVRGNGTMMLRGDVEVARVVDQAGALEIYDPQGLPIVRIATVDGGATVADRASRLVRRASVQPTSIAIDAPPLVVTGTRDPAVAALLSAPEVIPEVRVLAACEHLARGSR